MAELRAAGSWGRWLTWLLVLMAGALTAASSLHLLGAGVAWATPFVAVISALLVLAVLATVPAVAANVTWLRLALPVVLLGANAGFIIAHELGVRLVSFTPYSSTRFALTLMAALVLGAIGLLRRRMWARWLYLALGAAAIGSGGLNAINYWPVSGRVDPLHVAWSHQTIESCWGFLVSAIGPLQTVAPGASASFKTQLFVGPKMQEQLAAIAPGLDKTVDYGAFALLAQPLFWIIQKIHNYVGNWGLAIIICTLLIKLAFYKLSETSGRSMARMRQMQPRMKALQERYKDDKQALSTAMMDLYKKEKINPAAGCLPMLVQIPFFMAFYWVLLESVEMRQAPFMLWITDLSSRDPYFVLPLLMGAAMWFQQKLNPPPPDPVQAKMMQAMPIMMTGMFAFFPAGLVVYWLTNSVLSIAQQCRINKVLGAN